MSKVYITYPMGTLNGFGNKDDRSSLSRIRNHLEKLKNKKGIKGIGIFEGVAVYKREWGCPLGGEPVGVMVSGSTDSYEKICELQDNLRQQEVYISTGDVFGKENNDFKPTSSFLAFDATTFKTVKELGLIWQKEALNVEKENSGQNKNSCYVSCVLYKDANNRLFIQADYNEKHGYSKEVWKDTIKEVFDRFQKGAGLNMKMHFCSRYLNYRERNQEHFDKLPNYSQLPIIKKKNEGAKIN